MPKFVSMENFKTISLLLLLVLCNCNAQKEQDTASFEITYKAQTRGSFFNILYKKGTLTFKTNIEEKVFDLKSEEKERLIKEVSKIELSEIENLIAPSEKRFTDGALSANFIIKKNNTAFTSSDFDHKNPPEALKNLYEVLLAIIKKG